MDLPAGRYVGQTPNDRTVLRNEQCSTQKLTLSFSRDEAADLRFATLDQCHFRFCSVSRANLTGASMRGATLAGCDLTNADLTNCDLAGSTFTFVNTGGPDGLTTFAGASLQNANLNGVIAERILGWNDTSIPRQCWRESRLG
jgi:uncharacterized protein YjbI with pentapeptide repeats